MQYAYEDGIASNEAKYIRPAYVTYPGPSAGGRYTIPIRRAAWAPRGTGILPASRRAVPALPWLGKPAGETAVAPAFAEASAGRLMGKPSGPQRDAHGTHGRDAHATLAGRDTPTTGTWERALW